MRKTKRYMVGFDEDHHPIYGKDEDGEVMYADPMTLRQAERKLRELQGRIQKTIYKLVPVKARRPR